MKDSRALGDLIHTAARGGGQTDGQIAAKATVNLDPKSPPDLTVTAEYVAALRRGPRQPLSSPRGRWKFAAVVHALGVDVAEANRLAGGIG